MRWEGRGMVERRGGENDGGRRRAGNQGCMHDIVVALSLL